MTKKILITLLIIAGIFVLAAGSVVAQKGKNWFPVKELRVNVKNPANDEIRTTVIEKRENGKCVFSYHPIINDMLPFTLDMVGDENGEEKLFTSYCLQIVDYPASGERVLDCFKIGEETEFYAEAQGDSVINFFFGDFKYAEVKVAGENIKITFFVPEKEDNTRENKSGPRVSLAGL